MEYFGILVMNLMNTGHITEDPVLRVKMMDKRMSRLDLAFKKIPDEEQAISFGVEDFTIISWGSAKGPILDAIRNAKKRRNYQLDMFN